MRITNITINTSNNQRLANAGEDVFFSAYLVNKRGRVILFVHEHTLQVLLVFFLQFGSNNRVILQNL